MTSGRISTRIKGAYRERNGSVMDRNERKITKNGAALLPILVFLVLYLGMGLVFEYGMKIPMAFYDIPIVVVFMVALLVACVQDRGTRFDEKLSIMAQGVGDKNIMTMILIFLVAGVFVGVTGRSSAEAVAYFLLSVTPGPRWRCCSSPPASCPPRWAPQWAPSL